METLSDKITSLTGHCSEWVQACNVKEFIRQLKEEIKPLLRMSDSWMFNRDRKKNVIKIIDKLVGDKLT